MLNDSGLSGKKGVMAQKAAEKIKFMIKAFKNIRTLAESTEWGIDLKTHDEKVFGITKTRKDRPNSNETCL